MLCKGNRAFSVITAFLEVCVWACLVSGIISDLSTNVFWICAYCLGYTAGYYFGGVIESYLALGVMDVCIIAQAKHKADISRFLIENNFGYYMENCEGATGPHVKVDIILPRKRAPFVRKKISEMCDGNIFVTNYDVPYMHGGYANKNRAIGC